MRRPRTMIKIAPGFEDQIAHAGFSKAGLASESGVSVETIHAIINPSIHPDRRGGMRRDTAWKLARAVAAATDRSDKDVFAELFVEETITSAVAAPSAHR
jgi:hypothetical protein